MASSIICDSLWYGADIVTLRNGKYNLIKQGAIAVKNGKILWVGEYAQLPDFTATESYRLKGGVITPGLIDCHTHLIFGGNRSQEFEQRLNGISYATIAAQGGGILSTVNATREASEAELFEQAQTRLKLLLDEGVTCVEIKSGYGLTLESELKMLRVARKLGTTLPVKVKTTCLAAHALPPEYAGRSDDYIDSVCQEIIPAAVEAGLVDAVDVFCEHLAFSREQTERVFAAAKQWELPIKVHADQLSSLGASALAAQYQALSADHLEYTSEADIQAMATAGTVAVLLPGAYYLLRETQCPPIDLFRKYGVPMAIASDSNPGTSPALSLRLMLNMACTLFRLTPEEALAGVTYHAAQALGVLDHQGALEVGKMANFVHWSIQHPAELSYWLGGKLPCDVIYQGEKRQ